MSVHDHVDDFPHCPLSANVLADIVDNLQHARGSICRCGGKSCAFEDWKIGLIVTDIRNVLVLQTESLLDAPVSIEFVVQILVELSNAEFLRPLFNNLGHSSRDNTHRDAEPSELDDPVSVFHVEFLELFSLAGIVKASVGHHAVDVEKEKPNPAKR